MADKTHNPKEPLLALLLSFLYAGIGQLYCGYIRRGILIIVLPLLVSLLGMMYLIHPKTSISFVAVLILGFVVVVFGFWALVDSYQSAKRYNAEHNLERIITPGKRLGYLVGIILVLFIPNPIYPVAQYIRTHYFQAFMMPAGSMRMSLQEGDRILVEKRKNRISELKRGDVIVFRSPVNPERDFVKRLIAFGGETVEIIQGDVYVNGNLVSEPHVKNNYYYNLPPYAGPETQIEIPPGHYFVLGDNSRASYDSRQWGFVPKDFLIGIAYKIYWPPDRSGPIQ